MYIKKLIYRNVGPISSNDIDFRFTCEGNPVPTVIVGENGSGKSVFLSNITDAFYELAGTVYSNAMHSYEGGHQYYKTISPDQIKIGAEWLVAYIEFEHETQKLKYIFKAGNILYSDFLADTKIAEDKSLDWESENNFKNVVGDAKLIERIFDRTIVASLSPMRYEKPNWMGEKYYSRYDEIMFSHEPKFNGRLYNPISITCDSEETLKWLLDVIADSRADLAREQKDGEYRIHYPSIQELNLLMISRNNAEQLMSAILGQNVIFRLYNRSNKGRRLRICTPEGREIVHSLNALSTGQLALFNLFSSIIRYADNDDINFSLKLEDIAGIVLIDEIELHLHSKLQREVLPRLMALFPKVQFIVTSHSPLFLLGLQKEYGEDNIDIYEMPDATKISVEEFSEFEKAYTYYSDTQKHRDDIKAAITSAQGKDLPLIITEGSTDWKHMKAAYESLKDDERYKEWLPKMKFEFLEYESKPCESGEKLGLQMSCSELCSMCREYSKLPKKQKMIFIADNDDQKTKKELDGVPYKQWRNDVYSFCLPVPSHREGTDICIEHLYTDDEIKRKVVLNDGSEKRIFLGQEFDETGHLITDEKTYYCAAIRSAKDLEKNGVLDGSDNKKVFELKDKLNRNLALPKAEFAERVLNKKVPFDDMNFDSFVPIFERIRDILNET